MNLGRSTQHNWMRWNITWPLASLYPWRKPTLLNAWHGNPAETTSVPTCLLHRVLSSIG